MTSAIKELEELVLGSSLGEVKVSENPWKVSKADPDFAKRRLSGIIVEEGTNVPINFLGYSPVVGKQIIYLLDGVPERPMIEDTFVVGVAAPKKCSIFALTEEIAANLASQLTNLCGNEAQALFGGAINFFSPRSLWVKRVFTHLGGSNDYVAVSLRYDAQREVVAVRLPAQVIQPLLQG